MKQTQAFAPPPAPALDIPQDPEFTAAETARAEHAAAAEANQLSVRQRLDRGGLDEQLSHDPLRLHRALPPSKIPKPSALPPKAPKEDVLACTKEALQADGDEKSFEEMRATAWLKNHSLPLPCDNDVEMEIEEPAPPSPIPVAAVETKFTPFDQPTKEETAPVLRANAALEDTMHAFGTSGDVTIATRGAFDAINAAFGGMFGGDAPVLASMEPTMTISTKEAFAAINNIFSHKVRN